MLEEEFTMQEVKQAKQEANEVNAHGHFVKTLPFSSSSSWLSLI
jgi:hypothetical protein